MVFTILHQFLRFPIQFLWWSIWTWYDDTIARWFSFNLQANRHMLRSKIQTVATEENKIGHCTCMYVCMYVCTWRVWIFYSCVCIWLLMYWYTRTHVKNRNAILIATTNMIVPILAEPKIPSIQVISTSIHPSIHPSIHISNLIHVSNLIQSNPIQSN